MVQKQYKMRVNLTVKRLLDCPDGRSLYVKLHWGNHALWGGKKDYTHSVSSTNRTFVWMDPEKKGDEGVQTMMLGAAGGQPNQRNCFSYECSVSLDTEGASHEEAALAKLRKRQTSLAHLRLSLRAEQDAEAGRGKKKLGFIDIPLLDWAVLYGNQKEHNLRHLLDGTMSTMRLEFALKIEWIDEAPTTQGGDLYHSISTAHDDIDAKQETVKTESKMKAGETQSKDSLNKDHSLGDWAAYKMEDVGETTASTRRTTNSVQEALDSSRLTHEENVAIIDELVRDILGREQFL